jgi:hypothetical protein
MYRSLCVWGLTALGISGCGALARTTTLDEPLPSSSERSPVGSWDLGDRNCTGSIQVADQKAFWLADCRIKAGYGWCEFGVPLVFQGAGKYVNDKLRWSFTINDDGSLTESRDGKQVGQYAKSATGICGVKSAEKGPL